MKKILVVFLALITVLSITLVACKSDTSSPSNNGSNDDDDLVANIGNGDSSNNGNNGSGEGDGEGNGNTSTNSGWNELSKKVYTMCKMNIRKGSPTGAKTVVEASTELTVVAVKSRTTTNGTTEDDWYKLDYNGEEYYVDADFVSNNIEETKFTALSDELTIKVKSHKSNENPYGVNLRKSPSFDEDLTTTTVKKEHTDVNPIIAKKVNGTGTWYEVTYNNETFYLAVTSSTKAVLEGLPEGSGSGSDIPG